MAKLENRYANALLELALEDGTLERELEQAVRMREVLDDHEVQAFFEHPHVPDADKQSLIDSTFGDHIADNLRGLMYLTIRKSREKIMLPLLDIFITAGNRHLGRIEAYVVSAAPLSENELQSIRSILEKRSDMAINLHTKVDPDVLGGFYILMDGYVFDATIRSELNQIRERLKRGGSHASQT